MDKAQLTGQAIMLFSTAANLEQALESKWQPVGELPRKCVPALANWTAPYKLSRWLLYLFFGFSSRL